MSVNKKRGVRRIGYSLLVLVIIAAYGLWAVRKPLPAIQPAQAAVQIHPANTTSTLSWPGAGEAAVGFNDDGVFATHGPQKPMPTASVAKILTALTVLNHQPLAPGQAGPTLTLTASDVASYERYVAEGGSVVPVSAGEQISEYQVLQTMLLPSANNMADSLATWAFGSLSAYATAANSYAKQLGLTNTHVGIDASGFDPSTTSTASDLVKLGEAAMQNPVIAGIAAQTSATNIPDTDGIKNVNFLLGTHGIVGLKTGNSDQAGGVYLSATKVVIQSKPTTIITALLGAPTLYQALSTSLPLITSAEADQSSVAVINSGDAVGSYHLPWGGAISVVSNTGLTSTAWNGTAVDANIQLLPLAASAHAGQTVGDINVAATDFSTAQSAPLTLTKSVPQPTAWWRLTHP